LPLVIFLKHFDSLKNKFLVIEEPEAHFHPKAQIEIERLLVMFINMGAKVLVTTHSDYILNEINNCIKLNQLDKNKQDEEKIKKNILELKNKQKETIDVKAIKQELDKLSNIDFSFYDF